MARHENKLFRNQTITLDGNEYDRCRFETCVLQYQGLRPVVLNDNLMNDCQWSFKGPAANAVQFLSALHRSGNDGALLVEQTFNMIRGLTPAAAADAANTGTTAAAGATGAAPVAARPAAPAPAAAGKSRREAASQVN